MDVPAEEVRDIAEVREPRSARPFLRSLLMGAGLAAATVVLCLVAAPMVDSPGSAWREILAVSLALAHGTLVGVWIGWGGRASPWQFAVAWVALTVCFASFERSGHGFWDTPAYFWLWFMAAPMVVMGFLLFVLRFFGVELGGRLDQTDHANSEPPVQWLQFSLWSLLEWTAAIAVVLAASRYFPREWPRHCESTTMLGIFGASVLVGIGSVWALLGTRWTAGRLAALAGAAAVGVTVLLLLMFPPAELWELVWFVSVQVAYLGAVLGVARRLGCQLVWRWRTRL